MAFQFWKVIYAYFPKFYPLIFSKIDFVVNLDVRLEVYIVEVESNGMGKSYHVEKGKVEGVEIKWEVEQSQKKKNEQDIQSLLYVRLLGDNPNFFFLNF